MSEPPVCWDGCNAPGLWRLHIRLRHPTDWVACREIVVCEKHAATLWQDKRLSVVSNFERVTREAKSG